MLASTWKVITSSCYLPPGSPRHLVPAQSNNQLPGPKGCAQHGWFPSLLPAMPGRRLQLNRSATPTYVSTRGTTLSKPRDGAGRRV